MTHVPVLLEETLAALDVRPGGRYVDGTLGRAGHTKAILDRGGEVLGIDRDDQALAEVGTLKRLTAVKGRHGDVAAIARANGWNEVDGVLLDLGVSSPQLDEPARGFSFSKDGPLDMRMDRSEGPTAADLVNGESAEELEAVFRDFGEERLARRLAKAIVAERATRKGGFKTTVEFAAFVEKVLGRHGAHHPATKAFQALRMAVNDELGELRRALEGALAILASGGRFAVITFESITDREVKRFFGAHVGREVSLQGGGSRHEGASPRVRWVVRRAVTATAAETGLNPRARSAKLRAVERE